MSQISLSALNLGIYLRSIIVKTLDEKTDMISKTEKVFVDLDYYVAHYSGMWEQHHYDTFLVVLHRYFVANAFGVKRDQISHLLNAALSLLPEKGFCLSKETDRRGAIHLTKMARAALEESEKAFNRGDLVNGLRPLVAVMASLDPSGRMKLVSTIEKAIAST